MHSTRLYHLSVIGTVAFTLSGIFAGIGCGLADPQSASTTRAMSPSEMFGPNGASGNLTGQTEITRAVAEPIGPEDPVEHFAWALEMGLVIPYYVVPLPPDVTREWRGGRVAEFPNLEAVAAVAPEYDIAKLSELQREVEDKFNWRGQTRWYALFLDDPDAREQIASVSRDLSPYPMLAAMQYHGPAGGGLVNGTVSPTPTTVPGATPAGAGSDIWNFGSTPTTCTPLGRQFMEDANNDAYAAFAALPAGGGALAATFFGFFAALAAKGILAAFASRVILAVLAVAGVVLIIVFFFKGGKSFFNRLMAKANGCTPVVADMFFRSVGEPFVAIFRSLWNYFKGEAQEVLDATSTNPCCVPALRSQMGDNCQTVVCPP